MKSATKYWGFVGFVFSVCFSIAVLCASQTLLCDQAIAVWRIATYPVTAAWESIFRSIHGDCGMIFILPMFATQFLFVLAEGFVIGALFSKFLRKDVP